MRRKSNTFFFAFFFFFFFFCFVFQTKKMTFFLSALRRGIRPLSKPRTFFRPHPRTVDPHNRRRPRRHPVSMEPPFEAGAEGPEVVTFNAGDTIDSADLFERLRKLRGWEDPSAYVDCKIPC
jgi:hypothetical protein